MRKHLILMTYLASLNLTGCVYRIDIHQGNALTQKQVDQLTPGMTQNQVRYIMGTPLLKNPFQAKRFDYLSSFQTAGDTRQVQRLTLVFDNDDRLSGLRGDFRPHPEPGLEAPEVTTVQVPARKIEKGIFETIGDLLKNLFG